MTRLEIASYATPLGRVQMALQSGQLCTLTLDQAFPPFAWQLERRFPVFAKQSTSDAAGRVKRALDAYFAGDLRALAALPIDPGGSEFQRAVWNALCAVPVGETVSYGALARAIGRPQAARAVGAACGANPVWLVVPCHRAIGSDGHLVGYAAGLERKSWLLAHERARSGEPRLRQHLGLEVDPLAHAGDARAS
jgi:methylated-DNA-[protein]-cysteine S-methyltransferase